MANHVRKLQRSARRRQSENVPSGSFDELVALAGFSLGMSDQQVADAMGDLTNAPTELSDMVEARLLELMELLGDSVKSAFPGTTQELVDAASPDRVAAARTMIEQRRGAGFIERIAATGEPARDVVERVTSHKIQYGQLFGRARAFARQWCAAKWSGIRGGWLRRYTHGARRRSSSGRASVRTSSRARGKGQRSSFGGTSARSTRPSSSSRGSRSTQSDEPAGRSSDHHTHRLHLRRSCGSSTSDQRSEARA